MQWECGSDLAEYKASDKSERVGSGDPFFRYTIVTKGDKNLFIWTCYHGGFDDWTRRLIIDQVQEGLSNL